MPQKIRSIKAARRRRNFTEFGEIAEAEAMGMHATMLTSKPALIYWMPTTVRIMHEVINWRSGGLESYFTIDAGPNVHVLCLAKDANQIQKRLARLEGVDTVIVNQPANGATLL